MSSRFALPHCYLYVFRTSDTTKRRELNILLMGVTGVGKTTWINGFVNYLKYRELGDAEMAELALLIPMTLEIDDGRGNKKTVSAGAIDQHVESYRIRGQSVTQRPVSYEIEFGNHVLRLIDTPGVNDTRGPTADKENIDNILRHITRYDKLNAICILIKAGQTRLTTEFKDNLKQILANLHESAQDNIVFCLTHARQIDYNTGESGTAALLEQLKSERVLRNINVSAGNIFCFDGDAVRYLIKYKNDIDCTKRQRNAADESWEESVNSSKALLERIKFLPPHDLSNTASLASAKVITEKISEPLVKLMLASINGKRLTVRSLDHGRRVCEASSCASIFRGDVYYNQVCHEPCSSFGPKYFCKAFGFGGNCKRCCHHMDEHRWTSTTYEIEDDPDATHDPDARLAKSELKRMIDIAARLSVFMQECAAVETSTDILSIHLDRHTQSLEHAVARKNDRDARRSLDATINLNRQYAEEIKKIRSSRKKICPRDVTVLIDQLYDIPEYGPQLRRTVKIIEQANDKIFRQDAQKHKPSQFADSRSELCRFLNKLFLGCD